MDTSPEMHALQIELYRSMTPARRVEIAVQLSEDVWAITADGISARHPDYDEIQVRWACRRLRLGDDTFRRVWPEALLLAP